MPFVAGQILTAALLIAGVPIAVRKTADQTVNNSTVLVNDSELFWTPPVSTTYQLRLVLYYNSGTVPDIKAGWSLPAGATLTWGALYVNTAGGLTVIGNLGAGTLSIGGLGAEANAEFHGILTMGSTAGNVQLQWAQDTANASNTIVRANSHGYLIKT
jgi:hypothetical protein